MRSARVREKNVFITDCNAYLLFWVFVLGSVAGFLLEGIWCVMVLGHWENHSAVLWGPFCVIYGFGAVALYLGSYALRNAHLLFRFAAYVVTGTLIELAGSLVQEYFLHSVSWNYSRDFANLDGRISLKMSLIWGVIGVAFGLLLFSPLQRLLRRLNGKIGYCATWALILFMSVNLIASCLAVNRWHERIHSQQAHSRIDVWLDANYGNDKMEQIYQDMRFVN